MLQTSCCVSFQTLAFKIVITFKRLNKCKMWYSHLQTYHLGFQNYNKILLYVRTYHHYWIKNIVLKIKLNCYYLIAKFEFPNPWLYCETPKLIFYLASYFKVIMNCGKYRHRVKKTILHLSSLLCGIHYCIIVTTTRIFKAESCSKHWVFWFHLWMS